MRKMNYWPTSVIGAFVQNLFEFLRNFNQSHFISLAVYPLQTIARGNKQNDRYKYEMQNFYYFIKII